MAGWTLHFSHLPAGVLGLTDHSNRTITLARGLTQAQRRSTVAHEVAHAERPPFHPRYTHLEERAVDQLAARRLVPFDVLVDGCRWARSIPELAEECWVDEDTIRIRLAHLHPSERTRLIDLLGQREQGS